ncbi:Sphingosine N-acyltransferase lag1 [Umbelopsis nana]
MAAAAAHRTSAKKREKLPSKPSAPPSSFASFIIAHEIDIPGAILLCALVGSALGSPLGQKMVRLSYETQPGSNLYDKGPDDAYFVGFWVLAFTFLRASVMKYVFTPFARAYGADTPAKQLRFAEQGWSFAYYSIFWSLGMYVMYHSPHWFNPAQFWIGYPHILISGSMKWYYLVQLGFWIQQIYVLNIEKRRKDHYAMFSHHIITCILVISSYCINFTRIGNAVLCCMDLADILLPFAKILNYLNLRTLCDITFGLFALSWLVTRHVLFTMIIWSTAFDPPKHMDMKWEPEKGKYFTPFTQNIYLGLFLLLNMMILFWFAMILKVIVKVLTGNAASDTRSDSEDSGDEDKRQ